MTVSHFVALHKASLLRFFLLFIFSEAIFFLYWLAFPAVMNTDSILQWAMLHGLRPIDNWYPYVDTLWLGVMTLGSDSPVIAAATQLTLASAAFTFISSWLIGEGVPRWLVIPCHLAITLAPQVGIYNVTLWKDTSSGIFTLLAIAGWVMLVTRPPQVTRKSVLLMVGFAFITFCAAFFRHNQAILAPILALCVWLFVRTHFGLKWVYTISLLVLYILMSIPLQSGLVKPADSVDLNTPKIWVLALPYQKNDPTLTPEDRAYLESLVLSDALEDAPCYTEDTIRFGVRTLKDKIWQDPGVTDRLNEILLRQLTQNTGTMLAQRVCTTSTILGLPPTIYHVFLTDIEQTPDFLQWLNMKPIDVVPVSPELNTFLAKVLDWTYQVPRRYFIWTHLPALLLIILIGLVGIYRHDGLLFCIAMIYLILLLVLAAIAVSSEWRYLYHQFLFMFYALPILYLRIVKPKPRTGLVERGDEQVALVDLRLLSIP